MKRAPQLAKFLVRAGTFFMAASIIEFQPKDVLALGRFHVPYYIAVTNASLD